MFIFRSTKCPNSPLLVRGNMGQQYMLGHQVLDLLKPLLLKENICPKLWDTLGQQNSLGQYIDDLGQL
tara:strand:+ start:2672 stop:2875 length:204 start_codon:yes stop_codon:yes gene_type:complete